MILNNKMLIKSFFAVTLFIAGTSTNIWGMYTSEQAAREQARLNRENQQPKTGQRELEACATCLIEDEQEKEAGKKRELLDFWAAQVHSARKQQGFFACCSADCSVED